MGRRSTGILRGWLGKRGPGILVGLLSVVSGWVLAASEGSPALTLEAPEPTNLVETPPGLGRPGWSETNAPTTLDPNPLSGWTQPRPKEVVTHNLETPTDEPTDPEFETTNWVPLLLVVIGGVLLLFVLALGFLARRAKRFPE